MKILFIQFVSLTLLLCTDHCSCKRGFISGVDQTNEGNEFFVGFFRNRYGGTEEPEMIPPVLWITTKESIPVNVNVFTIAGLLASDVVTPGQITYIDIPISFVVNDSSEDTMTDSRYKGIHIKADDNNKIIVYGQHEEIASNDAYLALPIVSLPTERSHEYIVASILGDTGRAVQAKDSVALIVGTENDTEIILEPSVLISHPFAPTATGGQFIPGIPVSFRTVTIQRFQTFYLQVRGGDISGTRIIADKPISVFSGHECANVPLTSEPCDILIEQIPPIDTWGTEVVTIPLRTRSGDIIKVFASQDSTTVNVTYTDIDSGMVTDDSFSFTLNRNGFRELGGTSIEATGAIADFALIQSNNPIAVFQFSSSFATDSVLISDPFMLSVPSCEQYRDNFAIAPAPFDPSLEGSVAGRVAYVNYTNIAVPAEYFNASLITVNNNAINASEFRPIRRADNSIWGYGAQLLLDEGAQMIRHQDPNAALLVTLYGFSNQMSWGCTGGTGLTPIALSMVSFESPSSTIQVSESEGSLQVVLVLSKAVDQQVSVIVTSKAITAKADEDFGPPQSHIVTFPTGSRRHSVNIFINNDDIDEGNEKFKLEISVPEVVVRAGVIDGCKTSLIVEIIDDDVSSPRITTQPVDVKVTVYKSASFSCTARGSGIKIIWERVNYSLPVTADITEEKSSNGLSSTLRISDIVGYYSGQYYCVAENKVGKTASEIVNLHVNKILPPEMIIPPQNVTMLPNQDFNVNCLALSLGVLKYNWSKRDENLPQNAVRSYIYKTFFNSRSGKATLVYNLALPNVQTSDEGWYCCTATNEGGSTTNCVWLEIYTLPNITMQPTSVTFKAGELNVIAMSCRAVGMGPINYEWQKYHLSSNSWIQPSHRAVSITSPNLEFSVITEEDKGTYRCVITNDDGSIISNNATIFVFGPPIISFITNSTVSLEGTKVNLLCIANNDVHTNYSLQINWYKDEKLVIPNRKHVLHYNETAKDSRQVNSTLTFDPVKHTDDGEYSCRAFNHPTLYSELKTTLVVEYAPRVSIANQSPYMITVGSVGVLYCKARGKPIPTVQWYSGDYPVNPLPSHFQQVLLVPTDTPHTTVYTCVGINYAGNRKHRRFKNITVIVKDLRECDPLLNAPENGERTVIKIDGFIKHISFSCHSNYVLIGKSLATCNNGTWSSSAPVCDKKS